MRDSDIQLQSDYGVFLPGVFLLPCFPTRPLARITSTSRRSFLYTIPIWMSPDHQTVSQWRLCQFIQTFVSFSFLCRSSFISLILFFLCFLMQTQGGAPDTRTSIGTKIKGVSVTGDVSHCLSNVCLCKCGSGVTVDV